MSRLSSSSVTASPPDVTSVIGVTQSTSVQPTTGDGLADLRARLEDEADGLWKRLADGPLPDTANRMMGLLKSSYFWLTFALVFAGKSYNSY